MNWKEERRAEYLTKLKDPRWQRLRLEVMQRDGWTCRSCGDKTTTLNVHHLFYAKSGNPWDVPPSGLLTLCEPCHERETTEIKDARAALISAIYACGWTSEHLRALESEIRENASGSIPELLLKAAHGSASLDYAAWEELQRLALHEAVDAAQKVCAECGASFRAPDAGPWYGRHDHGCPVCLALIVNHPTGGLAWDRDSDGSDLQRVICLDCFARRRP